MAHVTKTAKRSLRAQLTREEVIERMKKFPERKERLLATARTGKSWALSSRSCPKAPKARNMKARGKREARRPWNSTPKYGQGLKGRNSHHGITPFSGLQRISRFVTRGDALRFATRLPLAIILRAFGACPTAAPDNNQLDYFGDTASGRLYPKNYQPSQPEQWLKNKRATLRRYDDNKLDVLWLTRH